MQKKSFTNARLLMLSMLISGGGAAYAIAPPDLTATEAPEQSATIQKQSNLTGTVKDENGDPVIGASVVVKGTTTGTITDADGRFTLPVSGTQTVQITYLGYQAKEIKARGGMSLNVIMEPDNRTLDDVVVTAFGIKREEKALGYAVQKVKGDELATVKSVDLGTSLTGKVAGLNV